LTVPPEQSRKSVLLSEHPNGVHFAGCSRNERTIVQEDYYSIGGGSITKDGVNVENAGVRKPCGAQSRSIMSVSFPVRLSVDYFAIS
jgi:Serine dehydratase beta chain